MVQTQVFDNQNDRGGKLVSKIFPLIKQKWGKNSCRQFSPFTYWNAWTPINVNSDSSSLFYHRGRFFKTGNSFWPDPQVFHPMVLPKILQWNSNIIVSTTNVNVTLPHQLVHWIWHFQFISRRMKTLPVNFQMLLENARASEIFSFLQV